MRILEIVQIHESPDELVGRLASLLTMARDRGAASVDIDELVDTLNTDSGASVTPELIISLLDTRNPLRAELGFIKNVSGRVVQLRGMDIQEPDDDSENDDIASMALDQIKQDQEVQL